MTTKLVNKSIIFFVFLLIAGLMFRLGLVYFQYSGDVKNHLVWAKAVVENPEGVYQRQFPGFNMANYPPLALIFFSLSWRLYQGSVFLINQLNIHYQFFPSAMVSLFDSLNMQAAFLKLPSIVSDLGIALLIFVISKRNKLLLKMFFRVRKNMGDKDDFIR